MKHAKIKELLPLYIDNGLTEEEKRIIENHLQNCEECQKELKKYQENYNLLSSLKTKTAPANFTELIMNKVDKEVKNEKSNNKSFANTIIKKIKSTFAFPVRVPVGIIALAAVILLIFITGLPGAIYYEQNPRTTNTIIQNQSMKMNDTQPRESENENLAVESPDIKSNQKLIKTAKLIIETENIEEINSDILNLSEKYSGYISNSRNWLNQNKRKFYWFELKIPASEFKQILDELSAEEYGRVISSSISTRDVTEEYTDLDIRLKNLLSQEEKYRQLLNLSNEVEEILKIENELNRVRTEIERLQGRKKYLDNRINYSTITVEFRQPESINPGTQNFIKAIRNALSKMVEQFYKIIILIGTVIPYLLLLTIGYILYKRITSN